MSSAQAGTARERDHSARRRLRRLRTRSASVLVANLASSRSSVPATTSQMCAVSSSACAWLMPLRSRRFTCGGGGHVSRARGPARAERRAHDAPVRACPRAGAARAPTQAQPRPTRLWTRRRALRRRTAAGVARLRLKASEAGPRRTPPSQLRRHAAPAAVALPPTHAEHAMRAFSPVMRQRQGAAQPHAGCGARFARRCTTRVGWRSKLREGAASA